MRESGVDTSSQESVNPAKSVVQMTDTITVQMTDTITLIRESNTLRHPSGVRLVLVAFSSHYIDNDGSRH